MKTPGTQLAELTIRKGLADEVFVHSAARAFESATTTHVDDDLILLGDGVCPFPAPLIALRANDSLATLLHDYFSHEEGLEPFSVTVGPGSKALLFSLLNLWRGEVVLPLPAWTAAIEQLRTLGRSISTVGIGSSELPNASHIDAAFSKLPRASKVFERPLLLLNVPNSPTGILYSDSDLKAIAETARKHNAVILADEIHAQTLHRGAFVSIAKHYNDTIRLTGLSKWTGAGSYRFGAYAIPDSLQEVATTLQHFLRHSVGSPTDESLRVAQGIFSLPAEFRQQVVLQNRILGSLGKFASRALSRSGLLCRQPDAGLYVYVDVSSLKERLGGLDVVPWLRSELKIVATPGEAFGFDQNFVRLALVDFDGTTALNAARLLPREQPMEDTFLRTHCPRVVRAVEVLCQTTKSGVIHDHG